MGSRSRTNVVAAVLVAVVVPGGVLSACVVFGPAWIAGNGSDLSTADRLAAENDVRSTLLQVYRRGPCAWWRRCWRGDDVAQVRANREEHSIDLFTRRSTSWPMTRCRFATRRLRPGQLSATRPRTLPRHAHAFLPPRPPACTMAAPFTPEPGVPAARTPMQVGVADDVEPHWACSARAAMIVDGASSELEEVDLRDAEADGLAIPQVCLAHSNLTEPPHRRQARRGHPVRRSAARDRPVGADLRGAT